MNTNDFSLGFARARRDLSCRYTLGFYDERPEDERGHDVRVKVKRPGLRASSPGGYAFRSDQGKRESLLTAAFVAPALFEKGLVRVHVFPVRPAGRRMWSCSVALEFEMPAMDGETAEREFAVFVRRGSERIAGFNRKVALKVHNASRDTRSVVFSQPVDLEPGEYTVTALVGDPARPQPWVSSVQVAVPPVPGERVFLVPPLLARQAQGDVVVQAAAEDGGPGRSSDEAARHDHVGDSGSLMPLLVQHVKPADRVAALMQVCLTGAGPAQPQTVIRTITDESGAEAFRWADPVTAPDRGEGMTCRPLRDEIPVSTLPPGDYLFRAALRTGAGATSQVLEMPFRLESGREP